MQQVAVRGVELDHRRRRRRAARDAAAANARDDERRCRPWSSRAAPASRRGTATALGAQIGCPAAVASGDTGPPPSHGAAVLRLAPGVRELHAGGRALLANEREDARQHLDVRVVVDPEIVAS